MSIFKKIIILVSCAIFILVTALCLTCESLISGMGDKSYREHLVVHSNVIQQNLDDLLKSQSSFGDILKDNPQFAAAVAAGDKEVLRKQVKEIIASPSIDFITVCDSDGVVLLRGHSDQAGDKLPSTRISMRVPLAEGRAIAGIEPGNVVKLALATGVPIKHEGKIVGVVILGVDISSGAFVNKMKELLHVECTIFLDDTRITTTVMNDKGKPAIGTKLNNDTIYQKAIGNGEKVLGSNIILGSEYDTIYWPWKDMTGKNAGLLFVGLSRSIVKSTQAEAVLYFTLVGLVVGAIMLTLSTFVARAITNPLSKATQFAEQVANGDLDGTLSVTTKDEVGALSKALGVMVETLRKMIFETEEKSREAEQQAKKAVAAMEEASVAKEKAEAGQQTLLHAAVNVEQVVDCVTAAVENINRQIDTSTGLVKSQREQVTNSASAMEEMNATVLEIAKNASLAAESSKRATIKACEGEQIVKESVASINNVQRDTQAMQEVMQRLGEQAKNIGSIMTVINDIADQTNLLALNAAIEAARAGEAGRGFAVVADEVRKLAEKTVAATKEVSSAITGIQAGARDSMEAVARTGQNLESTTALVLRSGESLHEIVTESAAIADEIRSIATASEEQTATSSEITRSLDEINASASETAAAMQTSADATHDLAKQTHELQELVQKLRKS